jgi:hypothetical protein
MAERRSLADLGFPSMPGEKLSELVKQAWEAMKAPGKAYNEGMTPDEMIRAGNDFAMTMGAGGSLVPKPGNSLGIFGGRLAKTANLEKLADAEKFEKSGIPADTIWKATGWGRGKDGKWRFEIPDNKAEFAGHENFVNQARQEATTKTPMETTVGSVYDHPELFKAYPQLKDTPLGTTYNSAGVSYGGKVGIMPLLTKERAHSTMLHELQHEVQSLEDFAKGNNTNNPIASVYHALSEKVGDREALKFLDRMQNAKNKNLLYKNSAGEVEARSVQARQNYSPLQRGLRSPWQDEDVPRNLQLPFGYK